MTSAYSGRLDTSAPADADSVAEPDGAWDLLDFEYDVEADLVATALPAPLVPIDEPRVRFALATRATGDGDALEGIAWLGLSARHGDVVGEYPIFSAATDHGRAEIDRDARGLPTRVASIEAEFLGNRMRSRIERRGHLVGQLIASVNLGDAATTRTITQFGYHTRLAVDDDRRLASGPTIVHVSHRITELRAVAVTGIVRLGRSPHDPVGPFRVRRMQRARLVQCHIDTTAVPTTTINAGLFEPHLHHRYEHLMPDEG